MGVMKFAFVIENFW